MKKLTCKISYGLLICLACLYSTSVLGIESALLLRSKMSAIDKTDGPIVDLALSIADIRNDGKNEIAVSGNGYMRILEWSGTTLESKWKSTQYSQQLGPVTLERIHPLLTTSYYSDNKLKTEHLVFIPTTAKAAETYRLSWRNNRYDFQLLGAAPFNWFRLRSKCSDGTTVIYGKNFHPDGNYVVLYKWNGTGLVEIWHGASGTDIKAAGGLLSKSKKLEGAFLVQDKQHTGTILCNSGSVEWKEIDNNTGAINLWRNNRIGNGKSLLGVTKKNSIGELWSIQYSNNEPEYSAKLYVSQLNGNRFSPFSRVTFKEINSDMIFNMLISDLDNDGIGEILGVEEYIRKSIPRNNPGDTGEEGNTLFITSNLFLAKWNGKDYEIKWHRKAIDERIGAVSVGDVVGNGNKQIVIADEKGFVYVFDMPSDK